MYLNLLSLRYSLNGVIQKNRMNKLDIHYSYWLLGRLAKTLGVWGLLGIVVILASSIFYFVNFLPTSKQLLEAQNELQNKLQNKLEYTQKNGQENSQKEIPAQVAPAQTSTQEIAEL